MIRKDPAELASAVNQMPCYKRHSHVQGIRTPSPTPSSGVESKGVSRTRGVARHLFHQPRRARWGRKSGPCPLATHFSSLNN